MDEGTKKKVIAIELVILLLVSTGVVYINLDKIENFFWQPETAVHKNDSFEEMDVLDPIAENVTEMLHQIDASMVHDYLEELVSYGPRPNARRSLIKLFDLPIEKVARFLYSEFESMGINVRYHHWEQKPTIRNLFVPKWKIGWFLGKNIEATITGTNESSDEIYIISAHYDTVPRSPGANDNGAGIAAILGIAEIMSKYSFDHTIRFLLTSGEEYGLLGANAYADEASKNNENIVAALFIEMFALADTKEGKKIVKVVEKETSSWISEALVATSLKYSDLINLEVIPNREDRHGDYISFLDFGYDSVTLFAYEEDPKMHKPGDTIERLNMPYLAKETRLMLATIAEWAWDVEIV